MGDFEFPAAPLEVALVLKAAVTLFRMALQAGPLHGRQDGAGICGSPSAAAHGPTRRSPSTPRATRGSCTDALAQARPQGEACTGPQSGSSRRSAHGSFAPSDTSSAKLG